MSEHFLLKRFSEWVENCEGSEKKESEKFLEKLLKAFGWTDSTEAKMLYKEKIPHGSLTGREGEADALIKGLVLVEMKSRGENLEDHFNQIQRYWIYLTPKPKYAILCNFDEFWIYDFDIQAMDPVDKIHTAKISTRYESLAFLFKEKRQPLFGNNSVEITEKQARKMGLLLLELKKDSEIHNKYSKEEAQRFILQCVLCMFAEDSGLLPNVFFTRALNYCKEGKGNTYDVLGNLFTEMNTPGKTPSGMFEGTPYFNGGLFREIQRIELSSKQINTLLECCNEDWNAIRPSIFGNIFEANSNGNLQHFTSEEDILKIVVPTIIEPLENKLEAASNLNELNQLLFRISQLKICDPACGSGNFIYVAYNLLKRLEAKIKRKIQARFRAESSRQQPFLGYVNTNQFFGFDCDPFAVELARVTMLIARKIAHDSLGFTEKELPLDNLDKNIYVSDSLFDPWPKADFYIGNPPFLGAKRIRKYFKDDEYVEKIFSKFSGLKDVDLCVYWFRLAHEKMEDNCRSGLVARNTIKEGKNRKASLDYILANKGYIHNAISSQKWSGEAKVYVSIINWSKEKQDVLTLDGKVVSTINRSLRAEIDIAGKAINLKANKGYCFQGVIPKNKGFILDEYTAKKWIADFPENNEVVKPYSMGANLAKNVFGKPDRWIIDFADRSLEEIEKYTEPFNKVFKEVRPERLDPEKTSEPILIQKWWRYKRTNENLRKRLKEINYYFALPRVSKWSMFIDCPVSWLPGDKNVVVASEDFYILGILSSSIHKKWVNSQQSTLGKTPAYTHTTCFETFPFPQIVDKEVVESIREITSELNQYRKNLMIDKGQGITDIYNNYFDEPTSILRKLHNRLDNLVLIAYGFSNKDDILQKLLELNLDLSKKEKNNEKVIGPWTSH